MLVITRREGESLVIGDDVKITVTEIKSETQIKVGIEAPEDIPVLRQELAKRGKVHKQFSRIYQKWFGKI